MARRRCTRCRLWRPETSTFFGRTVTRGVRYFGSWCHRCAASHDHEKRMDRKALRMLEAA